MNDLKNLLKIVGFVCCCAPTLVCGQGKSDVILPVHPAELLKCLPSAENGWHLPASNAKHLPENRPMAKALREYRRIEEPSPTPSVAATPSPSPAPTPTIVRISLVDTAGNENTLGAYAGPEASGRGERVTFGSIQATRIRTAGESDHVEAVLLKRFLVKIIVTGPPNEKVDKWMEKINLQALQSAAAKIERFNPYGDNTLPMERVDELNPQRTKTSRFSIAPEVPPIPGGQ